MDIDVLILSTIISIVIILPIGFVCNGLYNVYKQKQDDYKKYIKCVYRNYKGGNVYTIKHMRHPNMEYGEVYTYMGISKNKVILFNGDGVCKHISYKKFITEFHKIGEA